MESAPKAAPGSAAPTLLDALARALPYGPAVAEHVARRAGLDPKAPAAACAASADRLMEAVGEWEAWLASTDARPPSGHILCKSEAAKGLASADRPADLPAQLYDAFEPLVLEQQRARYSAIIDFPTFDDALREFFGRLGGQRAEQAKAARERAASSKVANAKRDAAARLAALEAEAAGSERSAQLILANEELVEAAIASVNEMLEGGMSWAALEHLIREEAAAGNAVAAAVDAMQLDQGRIVLLLPERSAVVGDEDDDDDDNEDDYAVPTQQAAKRASTRRQKVWRVTVRLDRTVHANAGTYYDARKKHQAKKERTAAANDKAVRAAAQKAEQQLKKVRAAQAPAVVRKPYWFERFHWFISSENYLVVSGRDAQQNELLVKRYLAKGDVYCHADLHGASSCIVKNSDPDKPISPVTLAQA